MVKTPNVRHSRTKREPLTIDLDAQTVPRVDEDADAASVASDTVANASPPEDAAGNNRGEEDEKTASLREPSAYGPDATPSATTPHGAALDGNSAASSRDTPPADSPRGGDMLSRVASGVIGAVVALLLAGVLQYAGVLGAPGSSGSGAKADVEGLRQQVAALQAAAATGDAGPRIDGLAKDLVALKAEIAALKKVAQPGSSAESVAALQALDARVKAVETALSQAGKGGAPSDPAALSAIGARVTALETAVKAAGDAVLAGGSRIAAVEKSVATLAAKVDTQASQPKIALAIATAGLKSAIERGAPFAAELDTMAALAPDVAQVAALRPYAEKGVASRDALVAATGAAADAMVTAATPVDPDAGFFDRLLHSAESLVTVRPIGTIVGTGPEAIVARMEVAIKAGDLTAAVAEFDTLPDPVKAAGAAFGDMLKARQAVEALLDQAVAAAMKA